MTAELDAIRAGRPFDIVLVDEHAGMTPANMEALRRALPGARCIVACREPDQIDALTGPGGAGVIRLEKPFGPTALAIALGHVSRQDVD